MRVNIDIEKIQQVTDPMLNILKAGRYGNKGFDRLIEFTKKNFVRSMINNHVNSRLGFGGFESIGDIYYNFIDENSGLEDMKQADDFLFVIKKIRRILRDMKLRDFVSYCR